MKVRTQELIGPALDWAVDQSEGKLITLFCGVMVRNGPTMSPTHNDPLVKWNPSTNPAQSWPIIERERLSCHPVYISGTSESGAEVAVPNGWVCFYTPRLFWQSVRFRQAGPTLLIAAMRCLVTSKLGDEVEVPDELLLK